MDNYKLTSFNERLAEIERELQSDVTSGEITERLYPILLEVRTLSLHKEMYPEEYELL